MWTYLSLLPIILVLWAIAGIWTVHCGSYPPQSCIFGQVLNIGAALAVCICIVRFHQLRDWGVKTWQNQLILWSGILCSLGTSIVGNFQVRCAGRQRGFHRRKLDYISLCFLRLLVALSVYSARKAFWDL